MSEFEFIFTSVTILLALAIARLLEGLRDTFDRSRRYWIHYLWVVNRLIVVFATLLLAFGARDRSGQGVFFFLIVLTPPAAVFLQVNALVTSQAGAIEDWKDHFWSVKKWFFGSNMLYVLGIFLLATYGIAAELGPIQRYSPPLIGLLLSIVGYRSSSERVQGVLAIVGIFNVAIGFVRIAALA